MNESQTYEDILPFRSEPPLPDGVQKMSRRRPLQVPAALFGAARAGRFPELEVEVSRGPTRQPGQTVAQMIIANLVAGTAPDVGSDTTSVFLSPCVAIGALLPLTPSYETVPNLRKVFGWAKQKATVLFTPEATALGRAGAISRRHLLATAAIGGVGALSAACGPLQQPSAPALKAATIEVLHNWGPARGELAALEEQIARFRQQAPQVTVRQNVVAGSHLVAAQTAVAAGTPPDVSFTTIVLVPGFAQIAEPVEKLLRTARDWRVDDYFDGARSAMSYQGQMLAASYSMSTFVVVYNQDTLDRVGLKLPPATWSAPDFWSWETFNEYATKLTMRSGSETPQWGWSPPPYAAHHPFYFQQRLWQAGGEWLDTAGQRVVFHQPPGVEALQSWVDQIRGLRVTPPVEWILQYQNEAAFLNGSLAMSQHQPERFPFIVRGAGFRWGAALPPKRRRQAAVTAGFGWVILRDAKQKEGATEFVRFACLPAQLVAFDLKLGALPPRKSAGQQPEWQQFLRSDTRWQVLWEATKMAKSFPTVPGWTDVAPMMERAIRSALDSTAAPRAALEDAARQADEVLARARAAAR